MNYFLPVVLDVGEGGSVGVGGGVEAAAGGSSLSMLTNPPSSVVQRKS